MKKQIVSTLLALCMLLRARTLWMFAAALLPAARAIRFSYIPTTYMMAAVCISHPAGS